MPVCDIAREDELVRLTLGGQLHVVVHDESYVRALEACAESLGVTLPVHLEVDVGMSRGGARPDEAVRMLRLLSESRRLALRGVFAHFSHARSDAAVTARQLDLFDSVLVAGRRFMPPDVVEHVASTYALARSTRYHRGMVRFGLAWLGYGLEELDAAGAILAAGDLRPVVRWASRIVQVKRIRAGEPVGYGARWTASRESSIALVPVGYADGYPVARVGGIEGALRVRLQAPAGGVVEAPIVGAVNMDQITVDVTDVVEGDQQALVGCEVELISRDPESAAYLPSLASRAGMIPHEVLTRLNPRVLRTVSVGSVEPSCTIEVVGPQVAELTGTRASVAVG
jgi:alanine racemase